MSSKPSTRKKRWLLPGTLAAVLVLLAMGLFVLCSNLNDLLDERLPELVADRTGGVYELQFDDISVGLLAGGASVRNLRLLPSNEYPTAPHLVIGSASVTGFRWLPFLLRGEIQLKEFLISGPKIRFTQGDTTVALLVGEGKQKTSETDRQTKIKRIRIENGTLAVFRPDSARPFTEIQKIGATVDGLLLDRKTSPRAVLSGLTDTMIRTGKMRYEGENGMYTLSASGSRFSFSERSVAVDSLRLIPNYPKYRFSRLHGHQVDRMELLAEQVRLSGLDIGKLVAGEVAGSRLDIRGADFKAFRSKDLPRGPRKQKQFLHVAFRSLPLPVTLDTVAIHGSDIRYTEHLAGVSQPGTVSFMNTNATLLNVTNDSLAISRNSLMTLDVTTDVMGASELAARFEFPLNLDGRHTVQGTLGPMAVPELNPVLEPVGLVRAERGQIHSMDFQMDLHPDFSTGWVELVYSDLRIDLLRPENVDDGRYRRLVSWMANRLKIKDNNNSAPYRRGEVSFRRIERKSLFNYWWKSLSSGLKESVGI